MDFPLFTPTGLIFVALLILGSSSFKISDCVKSKRNLFKSIIICLSISIVNWTVAILFILGVSSLGGYIVELYYIPFYLQFAYYVFCFISGLTLVSKTYLFLNKFYMNFLTKGIYSFKRKQKNAWD
mgnify:FL=1|jgi:hypothetical protein